MKIVSICPSNTEMLYYLGIRDQVIALDDYSDWPEEWRELPRLGPDLDIDIEKIKKLRPDLVIASLSVPGMEKNILRLQQEHIPYIILNPKRLSEIANDFYTLGKALKMQTQAADMANAFLQEIRQIQDHIPRDHAKSNIYWEWWPKPVFSPGRLNWLTEISNLVGAENIFADQDVEAYQTTWLEVAQRQPDLALIVWTGIPIHRIKKSMIIERPPFNHTNLSHKKNIHILEEGWYCRPSPRLLMGIKHLAHLLYPDRFTALTEDNPFVDTRKKPHRKH
ncbi:ABC transporter substrate-binding protein [Hazenella sp. IB182357]|uniref:ABC transporter substrate-binding protein n=1 Tax=Polycladospora coralii TaxID=2771432 RepID=A0A926RT56_9BACL|nr:helical backbone metal receptor [Polycladospora coralii]MBD1370907.1 ABC transporter substrate-binding protein [Polycladospora coralii]MBS7529846.1 ABC transporter substrate-binding protein [Polycladospora coralii]